MISCMSCYSKKVTTKKVTKEAVDKTRKIQGIKTVRRWTPRTIGNVKRIELWRL